MYVLCVYCCCGMCCALLLVVMMPGGGKYVGVFEVDVLVELGCV